jgi:hypothetical protein
MSLSFSTGEHFFWDNLQDFADIESDDLALPPLPPAPSPSPSPEPFSPAELNGIFSFGSILFYYNLVPFTILENQQQRHAHTITNTDSDRDRDRDSALTARQLNYNKRKQVTTQQITNNDNQSKKINRTEERRLRNFSSNQYGNYPVRIFIAHNGA